MDDNQTSFVPQRSVQQTTSSGMDFLTFSSIIILLILAAAFGGLFLYKRYINNIITQDIAILGKQKGAFETNLIQELIRLNLKIDSAKEIITRHPSPSLVFDLLEDTTLKSVRFVDFRYSLSDNEVVGIEMNGVSGSYADVVLQSKNFADSKYIKDAIFSGLNVNKEGNVVFNMRASLDPNYILYSNRVSMGMASSARDNGNSLLQQIQSDTPVSVTATSSEGSVRSTSSAAVSTSRQ